MSGTEWTWRKNRNAVVPAAPVGSGLRVWASSRGFAGVRVMNLETYDWDDWDGGPEVVAG